MAIEKQAQIKSVINSIFKRENEKFILNLRPHLRQLPNRPKTSLEKQCDVLTHLTAIKDVEGALSALNKLELIIRQMVSTHNNKINEATLREIDWVRFELTRAHPIYKLYYDFMQKLSESYIRCPHKNVILKQQIEDEFTDIWLKIWKKWHILIPINPYLKIGPSDFEKRAKRGTILAETKAAWLDYRPINIVSSKDKGGYEFGLADFEKLKKRAINWFRAYSNIHQKRIAKDENIRKYCVWFYSYMTKKAYNKKPGYNLLSYLFNIDKNTAKRWIKQIDDLPKLERDKILEKALRLNKYPDKDIFDSGKTVSLHNQEYSLTTEGQYKTGKKLKHRSSEAASVIE